MPERITKEMLPDGFSRGARVDPVVYDEMLTEYYALRGWDADGVVTKETALRLDLDEPDA